MHASERCWSDGWILIHRLCVCVCVCAVVRAGSQLIQCPQCNNTLDPNSAHQIRCTGCTTLLAYPASQTTHSSHARRGDPFKSHTQAHAALSQLRVLIFSSLVVSSDSKYIQCPKCLHTMDPREVGPLGTAGSAVPPVPHHHSTSHAGGGGGAAASTEPKKRRDPNAPKAVCNAYMIFCKSRRGELKNELPELAFGKIGAKLGEMWRNMTSEEKKPYEDRAMVDRERYRKEMVTYTRTRIRTSLFLSFHFITGWIRDLTAEGIEPNPGMPRANRKRKADQCAECVTVCCCVSHRARWSTRLDAATTRAAAHTRRASTRRR